MFKWKKKIARTSLCMTDWAFKVSKVFTCSLAQMIEMESRGSEE